VSAIIEQKNMWHKADEPDIYLCSMSSTRVHSIVTVAAALSLEGSEPR
jgi:hypothetical protein